MGLGENGVKLITVKRQTDNVNRSVYKNRCTFLSSQKDMIRVRLLVKTYFRFSLKCSLKVDNSGDSVGGRGN